MKVDLKRGGMMDTELDPGGDAVIRVESADGRGLIVQLTEQERYKIGRRLQEQRPAHPQPVDDECRITMSIGQTRTFIETVMREVLDREVTRRVDARFDDLKRFVADEIIRKLRA